jgi:DNA replication factor Cdt1 C-terminal domain
LHKFFLRALSIHYAHNGPQAPAELGRLLDTITKLWKERLVTQADIQKMLAIYEMKTNAQVHDGGEIPHSLSPFKVLKAGSTISVEYAGERKSTEGPMSYLYDDRGVHDSYRAHVYALDSAWTKERPKHLSVFEDDSFENFAKLACEMGTQTAARNTHVARQRAEILTLSNAAQLRNTPTTTSPPASKSDDISNAIAVVERRKQNLLDRIKVKQLASKLNAKPTHQQILRKHAIGRIEDVTDILRMMHQQQKGEGKTKTHDNKAWEIKSADRASRVSFSLTQLRNDIKSSSRVPISDEEVTMCLKILSEELDGAWVKMIKGRGGSGAVFVVVEGEGISGREVRSRLMVQGS